MQRAIADVFPTKPKGFFWPEGAVDKNCRHVAQQERVFGLNWLFPPEPGADATKRARICILDLYSDRGRAFKIAVFFVPAEDSVTVPLSSKHLHARQSLFGLVPLLREFEYAPEDLQLTIDRSHLKPGVAAGSDKRRNILHGDFV